MVVLCSQCPIGLSGSLLDHLSWVLQECPLCGYCESSFCNWVLIVISPSMFDFSPHAGWLWGFSLIILYNLLCRCWTHKVEFASMGSNACWDLPLDVPLVELIGSCSDVFWSWPLCVLVVWPLRRNCGPGQCHTLPGTGSGKPGLKYKMMNSLWVALLVLIVYGIV